MSFNTLREGSRGPAVTLWQHVLNSDTTLPSSPVTIDGIFGAATAARTRDWQAARGLVADGVVGSVSWSRAAEEEAGKFPEFPAPAPPFVPLGRAERAFSGARLVDSYPFSLGGTSVHAKALRAAEVDAVALYLGIATRARAQAVLAAGLRCFGVTLANRFDGAAAVAQAQALGMPPRTANAPGVTLALDIEGKAIFDQGTALIEPVRKWRETVQAAGYSTLLYVGSPQPLTSEELGALGFDGYWNALSREVDRTGKLAEPARGWCLWQMIPEMYWKDTGVFVDVNMAGQDFSGTMPLVWMAA